MAFPKPYAPEDLPQIRGDQLSPFPLTIDLTRDNNKIGAWSLMKHYEHRFKNGDQVGPVMFDHTTSISSDLQKQFDAEDDEAWADCLLMAADVALPPKRTRFADQTPPRKRPVYRKTPPINQSSHKCQASPGSSPSSPLSPLSLASLQRLEQTFPLENCAVDR